MVMFNLCIDEDKQSLSDHNATTSAKKYKRRARKEKKNVHAPIFYTYMHTHLFTFAQYTTLGEGMKKK